MPVELERVPLSPRARLEFEAVGVESVSDGRALSSIGTTCWLTQKHGTVSRLAANVFQRCCHAEHTKERSRNEDLPRAPRSPALFV